jgi:hypothetical protein
MGANMSGANMYRVSTCQAPTCTGRQHVLGVNMSGTNMYRAPTCRAPICTMRKHVGTNMYRARTCRVPTCTGRQLKGANLTPFFSKNTPKLPFLAEEAQIIFFNIFFALSTVGSCPILLGEHVQKNSQI